MPAPFVPDDFDPPQGLRTADFVLEPLGPEHNERDHAAWSSSLDHIQATPGFGEPGDPDPWPVPMSLADNLGDLEMHARDFRNREGFTYTVLDPAGGDVIGCVYIYPPREAGHDARVRSWTRTSHDRLDEPLWRAVSAWLAGEAWPFERPRYAPRPAAGNDAP